MLDLSSFKKLAQKGNLIALKEVVPADLETPVSTFLKVASKEKNAFLLESAEYAESIGRYSVIGVHPEKVFFQEDSDVSVTNEKGQKQHISNTKLIDLLQQEIKHHKLANPQDVEGFCGGLVGYFSFENVVDFEDIQLKKKSGPAFPMAVFFLCNQFLIFDHFRKTLSAVVICDINQSKTLSSAYKSSVVKINKLLGALQKPLRLEPRRGAKPKNLTLKSNMPRSQFEKNVNRVKQYIKAGDCIQVVLSQRFSFPRIKNDFQIYRALRSINPSPYMFYYKFGDYRLIGSSPEVLVKKTGKVAEVRPIAGTRPRGRTREEDLKHEENLKKSPKEMAEHLMLVDLGRNDLGRVCKFESVKVKDYARVERYSHVMHIVSDVQGKLKPRMNSFDLLKATFPAGTVSGAPKIRAMEIINELEPHKRGPYAGCLGYFSFNHDMDTCITIRTLSVDKKEIHLQAGAGIVKDSNPSREYDETVNKAKALIKALSMQGVY